MAVKTSYKKWSKEERNFSAALTKHAATLGWIKPKDCCERCGQTKGIIHLHNEDYDVTIRILQVAVIDRDPEPYITDEEKAEMNAVLEVLCWRCHMIHHSKHRSPAAHDKYFAEVAAGKCYPPVYVNSPAILKENGL